MFVACQLFCSSKIQDNFRLPSKDTFTGHLRLQSTQLKHRQSLVGDEYSDGKPQMQNPGGLQEAANTGLTRLFSTMFLRDSSLAASGVQDEQSPSESEQSTGLFERNNIY